MSDKDNAAKLLVPVSIARPVGTKATNDEQLVASWVANLNSAHNMLGIDHRSRRARWRSSRAGASRIDTRPPLMTVIL
jgi:hypothetical protein